MNEYLRLSIDDHGYYNLELASDAFNRFDSFFLKIDDNLKLIEIINGHIFLLYFNYCKIEDFESQIDFLLYIEKTFCKNKVPLENKDYDPILNFLLFCQNYEGFLLIDSGLELFVLSKIFYFYHKLFNVTLWLKFDLLPGFGKTFQNIRLGRFLDNKIHVVCPTAKAALFYKGGRTIHSFFNIPMSERNTDAMFPSSNNIEYDFFVIDEFSMVSCNIMSPIFQILKNKKCFVVITGDSSQLKPISSRQYDFDNCNFKILNFTNKRNCFLPRFFGTQYYDRQVRLLYYLKELIKEKNAQKKTYELNIENLEMWLECLSIYDISNTEITDESIIDNYSKTQQETLSIIKSGRQENYGNIKSLPISIGFCNKYNLTIQNKIFDKYFKEDYTIINGSSVLNSTVEAGSIFITRKIFNNHYRFKDVKKICSKLSGSIGDANNNLKIGSYCVCRINDYENKTFNGVHGVIIKKELTTKTKNIETIICDNKKYSILDDDDNLFNLKLTILLLHNSKIIEINISKKFMCKMCEEKKCVHQNENPFYIQLFYWHSFYSCTLYFLQGSTIDYNLVCNSKEVFKRHKLISSYLILSRIKDPKMLCIDKQFILETLEGIYGKSKKHIMNFISKNYNLGFYINSFFSK